MKFFSNIVRPSINLLPSENKAKGVWLVLLLFIQTLLDLLSVASFFPLAITIIQPSLLENATWVTSVFQIIPFVDAIGIQFLLIIIILIFFIFKHVAGVFITRFRTHYAFDVASHLSKRLMTQSMNQPYSSYYKQKSSGELINVVHLPAAFAQNILLAMTTLFIEVAVLMGIALLMIKVDWHAFLFMCGISLPAILFYLSIKKKLSAIGAIQKANFPKLIERVLTAFDNFIEINIYQKSEAVVNETDGLTYRLNGLQVQQATQYANSMRYFETTAALGLCMLIGYLLLVNASVENAVLLLGIYSACGFRAIPSVNRIIAALFQIKTNEFAIKDILEKLNSPYRATGTDERAITFNSVLRIQDVIFQYDDRPLVIDRVNLSINKGEKIIITGNSGAGKSTLLLLLMGFLSPQKGNIFVDDSQLNEKIIPRWQALLSYVPQSPVLFDGSILENIAFELSDRLIDSKKVNQLITAVGLQDWLRQLPLGLNTQLGEKGIQISGGQRQRLAIARALYMNRDVILLDEVTSNLNEQASHELMHMITKLPQTVLLVSHDEKLRTYFRKSLLLEGGALKEI